MKRITSFALSAALLASLSTPVLAAPAISVDAAPTAAVLEEENSLWELPQADTPDMSNTVWSFAGGYIDGGEMTQAEMDESLAAYGGTLQFTFDAAGGAKMIQGGGTLNGTYSISTTAAWVSSSTTTARSCATPASLPGRTRASCSWSPSRMWRVPTAFTLSSKFVSSCLSDAMQISLVLELWL